MLDSVPCVWLVLQLPLSTIQFSLDHGRRSRKRNRKKWKRFSSSDFDSLEVFDFHYVASALTTPTPVKTAMGDKDS